MVIGLLVIAGIPTTIGVGQAVSAQKKQNAAAKEKAKFTVTVELSIDGGPPKESHVVLGGGKVRLTSCYPSLVMQPHPLPAPPATQPSAPSLYPGHVPSTSRLETWVCWDAECEVLWRRWQGGQSHHIGAWDGWHETRQHTVLRGRIVAWTLCL